MRRTEQPPVLREFVDGVYAYLQTADPSAAAAHFLTWLEMRYKLNSDRKAVV